jgi:hypothetical protein
LDETNNGIFTDLFPWVRDLPPAHFFGNIANLALTVGVVLVAATLFLAMQSKSNSKNVMRVVRLFIGGILCVYSSFVIQLIHDIDYLFGWSVVVIMGASMAILVFKTFRRLFTSPPAFYRGSATAAYLLAAILALTFAVAPLYYLVGTSAQVTIVIGNVKAWLLVVDFLLLLLLLVVLVVNSIVYVTKRGWKRTDTDPSSNGTHLRAVETPSLEETRRKFGQRDGEAS